VVSTGGLSLRKGAPYLLEALRLVHQRHPSARFLLSRIIADSALPVVAKYRDLPIDWAPGLPHAQLAARLQRADVFVLPSLEEGLVRTALEAMACGLPVVLTPNTGANDFVRPDVSGSVVPIRDARAVAEAILAWGDRAMASDAPPQRLIDSECLTFAYFEREFIAQLKAHALL
jgi:glycosyltransferase involved in cell wall biosynthesis